MDHGGCLAGWPDGIQAHLKMGATWAQGVAHNRVVRATPMSGRMGFTLLTRPGKNSFTATPACGLNWSQSREQHASLLLGSA